MTEELSVKKGLHFYTHACAHTHTYIYIYVYILSSNSLPAHVCTTVSPAVHLLQWCLASSTESGLSVHWSHPGAQAEKEHLDYSLIDGKALEK